MDVLVNSENTLVSIHFCAWAFYGRIRYHKKFSCSLLYRFMNEENVERWCFWTQPIGVSGLGWNTARAESPKIEQ